MCAVGHLAGAMGDGTAGGMSRGRVYGQLFICDMPTIGPVDEPSIPVPLDLDDLMWAAACYVFGPLLCVPLLFSRKREIPYVLFHALQALTAGILGAVLYLLFSLVLWMIFNFVAASGSIIIATIQVGLLGLWLVVGLAMFVIFAICAFKAGRGDVFKLPICGEMIENRVLSDLEES